MCKIKCFVILVISEATGIVSKGLKHLESIPGSPLAQVEKYQGKEERKPVTRQNNNNLQSVFKCKQYTVLTQQNSVRLHLRTSPEKQQAR
jgi:hypothetical protein